MSPTKTITADEMQHFKIPNYERAVRFAMGVILRSSDWQEAQHALANHEEFGPWLLETGCEITEAQNIIREAEDRLGDRLPANYS